MPERSTEDPVRYAVVGLGWFAQVAVLPAFANAENAELAALVSGDREKLRVLGERHGVGRRVGYDGYEELLASGEVDAVYLVLPNHLHREYTVAAARAGVDVLVEKPMAVTEAECREMIEAAEDGGVRLMVAYRLHFERANTKAVGIVRSGKIGEPRIFSATFANQVTNEDDIRLNPVAKGGGSVWDLGIYCINAARYVFGAEPTAVTACSASGSGRFADTEEMTSAVLRFPDGRLASFTSSFGAADSDSYRVVGTEGELLVEPAYEFKATLRHRLRVGDETTEEEFPPPDHVAAELVHFSGCIRDDREPEPNGHEGLADVRIIEAIHRSAAEGRAIELEPVEITRRPGPDQEITRRPAPGHQELVNTEAP